MPLLKVETFRSGWGQKVSKIITDLVILRAHNNITLPEEVKDIIKELEISLQNSAIPGVGLAAPQIGINKKIAIVRMGSEDIDLVNPIIVERENGFINFNEGCLSMPGKRVNTYRYKEIFVKDDLHPDGIVAVGGVAVAIEHEFDHLGGILMIDRAIGKNKIGRNDPCPCGKKSNGKPIKWKNCHGKC